MRYRTRSQDYGHSKERTTVWRLRTAGGSLNCSLWTDERITTTGRPINRPGGTRHRSTNTNQSPTNHAAKNVQHVRSTQRNADRRDDVHHIRQHHRRICPGNTDTNRHRDPPRMPPRREPVPGEMKTLSVLVASR